jgi:hypothetical protein
MKKLAIFGSGGFAKELVDLAIDQGYRDMFLERSAKDGDTLLGFSILPESAIPTLTDTVYAIGVADPKIRKRIYEAYPDLPYPNLIHSQSSLGYGIRELLEHSKGVVIAAGARITNSCRFGHFIIVSFNSTIGHDCILENYVSVMPGANVSGCIHLKQDLHWNKCCYFARQKPRAIEIFSENSVIGAGAVVVKHTEPNKVYIGSPAKELSRD